MLLSTDWFFDHWSVIGLQVAEQRRSCVQQGCRHVVRQMISRVDQYWHISFSQSRIAETRSLFFALMAKCHFDRAAIDRIKEIELDAQSPNIPKKQSWILTALTERLLEDGESRVGTPSAAVVAKVKLTWEETAAPPVSLKQINLGSASEWDQYIRSLTPDLPTLLSDYASTELIKTDRFVRYWTRARDILTTKERNELLSWYTSAAAHSEIAENFHLPDWLRK
jgi:hypothetical protein